jgi:hypothetical protein
MKMVGHQDIAVELNAVDVERLVQKLKKAAAVGVIPVDVLFFVAAAGNVINGIGILDA